MPTRPGRCHRSPNASPSVMTSSRPHPPSASPVATRRQPPWPVLEHDPAGSLRDRNRAPERFVVGRVRDELEICHEITNLAAIVEPNRAHEPVRLTRYRLTEVHVPVPDFTAPTPDQLRCGVEAIQQALAANQRVAVHCAAGLGRTGTLLACYLVSTGMDPSAAIARIRSARPGSVETPEQEAAVSAFATRC